MLARSALLVVALAALVASAAATYGVDVSQPTSTSAFECLKKNGYDFAIIRGFESVGRVDPAVYTSVANAHHAGMAHVDVYMFPCPKCGNPEGQVRTAVEAWKSHGVSYGMMWLDIEGSQYWLGSCSANQAFFKGLVNEAHALGVHLGVYTSESQWSPIMCNEGSYGSLPLWYAHYDGSPSFSDFRAFGGWSRPAIKQFRGDVSECGAGIDANWYP